MCNCFGCKESISAVALTSLVYTWEPVEDELVEVGWHKNCYAAQQAPAPDMASACPECGETLYIQCDDPKCMYERPKWQASEKSSKRELANKISQRVCSVLEYTPSEIQWKKLVDGIEHELNRPTPVVADGLCRDCGKNPAMKGYDLCKECGL